MKKIKYIILLLPLLSGCYNYRELNELGITTAVSIDYKDNNFILIAEVVNPIKQQDVSASNNSPFVNFTSVAPSIQEAFRNTVLESPRQLYLSQLEIILVSEEIINNHLEEFLEFFSREPETRTEIKVIIAKTEESTKGITIQSLLTNFSSSNILESLEVQNKLLGLTQEVTINELLNMYLDPNLEIVLPSMILYGSSDIGDEKENITTSTPKTLVKVGTTSAIKDGKILGYLSEEESKMVNLINGNLTKTILKIPYEDGYVVFEPNRIKTKQKLDIKDNKITIEISGFSKIKEFHTTKNIKNMKTVEKLNKYFNKEIENMIKDNFNQIREKYNTDMFGFQELYYRTDHKYFKKYCSNWYETTFPNIELEVKSNIKLYEKGNTLGGIKYERENN